MPKAVASKSAASAKPALKIGDEAVAARTGKTWPQWFALLDAAGAAEMDHKQIVALLSRKLKVGPWWQQMVTVAYEQARGLREKHETPGGYEVSRSKTIAAPIADAFKAWNDARLRGRWLGDAPIEVRKATANKSLRIGWTGGANLAGASRIDVMLYAKGAGKTQVTVDHRKLADAKQAGKMKAYWGEQLERLKSLLEA